mmetsp:Transcript_111338/g.300325  ORF Transcript_111338/g.300325 Transcript_111338/m.300325 type:complete len:453 (-) Transcript_111338:140-1498(-)
MRTSLTAAVFISAAVAATPHPERVAQIQAIQAIAGVQWKAALVDRFAHAAPGASKSLNGVKGDWKAAIQAGIRSGKIQRFAPSAALAAAEIPESFDSATNWPQCAKVIDDIRDQSNCGCCWAFAGVEAASDRMCITSNATLMLPLSDQDVCFCGSDDGCGGGMIDEPWDYIKQHGAVTGGQYQGTGAFGKGMCSDFSLPHCHHHGPQGKDPFPAEGQPGCPSEQSPQCPSQCDAAAGEEHRDFAGDKYSFSGETVSASGVKEIQQMIMAGGPVETAFTVYSDFENYAGGIYHHVSGGFAGGHAVKIVGWGTDNGVEYWKIANSWNPHWGEDGYFRIKRGECGIDDSVTASSPDSTWSKMGPSPGPAPGPGPSPGPPTPGCADTEEQSYCHLTKKLNFCPLLSASCQKTCGCCDPNPPPFCVGTTAPDVAAVEVAEQAVLESARVYRYLRAVM